MTPSIDEINKPVRSLDLAQRKRRDLELMVLNLQQELSILSEFLNVSPQGAAPVAVRNNDYFYITTGRRLQKISFHEIAWIESNRNIITIFTDTRKYSTLLTINQVEQYLPSNLFCRIHKSFIVSLPNVEFVKKDTVGVEWGSTIKELPVGAQFKKSFVQLLEKNVIRKNIEL